MGGIIPPKISIASALIQGASASVVTEAEELAVLAETLLDSELAVYPALFPKPPDDQSVEWALATARSLLSVASILGERALLFAEVNAPEDSARWRDLAAIEKRFFAALESKGVMPRVLAKREAIAAGCAEEGIEEIVLPAAVDVTDAFIDYLKHSPQRVTILIHADENERDKFDEFGRPVASFAAPLSPAQIEALPTAVIEADHIADFFKSIPETDALPALAVCDAAMYPELEGAFQNHFSAEELVLRNPAVTPLVKSALGRLLISILDLERDYDCDTLSCFLRMGDVVRWAANRLGTDESEVLFYLGALDAVRSAYLPRTLEHMLASARAHSVRAFRETERAAAAGLVRYIEAVKAEAGDPIGFLKKIFSSLVLDERRAGDRELIAAAQAIRDVREQVSSERISPRIRGRLRLELIRSASYMLEPLSPNVLATLGWLELPWCGEEELVLAGFNEGCVPENVVGHPFVPDSLRSELKLLTNARREVRDSYILAEAIRARKSGAVRLTLHQIASDKNVMKPSRLIFPCISESDLPALAMRVYAVTKGADGAPAKELPEMWKLNLPIPPLEYSPRASISVTALEDYRTCPFGFYLKEVFGERTDDYVRELDDRAFGSLCHRALEYFATSPIKDSTDAKEIAAYLSDQVTRLLSDYGEPLPAILYLQGEALKSRLEDFAVHQAAHRAAGWRILRAEHGYGCTLRSTSTLIRGKIDRIDENELTGELLIIDYKTWNRPSDDHFKSIQLPIYRAMLEASGEFDADKARHSKAIYCVLAERAEDSGFLYDHPAHEGTQSEDESRVVELLNDLARGIFYPPKNKYWKDDFERLIWESLDRGLSSRWLEDQLSRIAAAKEADE